ncbi:type VII secretion-associated serine protease mycosin, partial [Streptomyces daliensis]|nr:type VII secretion-associated serine protease mycosin [Streptomyces daliensis]
MGRTDLRSGRLRKAAVGCLGVLLVGMAATPAHAESVRSQQWHLDAMHAEEMWKTSKGEGVTVAVIDSGVDASVPDLRGQVLKGEDMTDRSGDAQDDLRGHGTSMAALIAGTGKSSEGQGAYGLAPAAKILPIRLEDSTQDSKNQAEAEKNFPKKVAPAIRRAADSEAKIINISLGSEGTSKELTAAVKYALSKDKLVFAAVGNEGDVMNPVGYPAATPGVIGVGAIGKDSKVTKESVTGEQVDLVAPGKDMVAACTEGSGVCTSHGTSDATAIASASAALIWSKHPDWTANQVTRVLVSTAGGAQSGKERTDEGGYGAVRPRIALAEPGDPGDPKTNPLPGPYYEGDKSGGAEKENGKGSGADQAAAASGGDGGTSTGQWVGYGVGGV